MTCGSRGKGVCQPISLKSAPPWLRSADPRTPPPYPRWGSRYPPKRPPQGAGGCHPLAEAATTSFSTRRRSHLWEPRRPRLSSPAPLSIATWLLGLLDLAARFRFPSSPLLSLCPSRNRAAARAERTAALRVVPEAQPPLLLEPIQREQLAAAIMVSWGGGGLRGARPGGDLPSGGNSAFLAPRRRGAEIGVTPLPCSGAPARVHHRWPERGGRGGLEAWGRGGIPRGCR